MSSEAESELIQRKAQLLDRILVLGEEILEIPENLDSSENVLRRMEDRSSCFHELLVLNSQSSAIEPAAAPSQDDISQDNSFQTDASPSVAVESDERIRIGIYRIIEQNRKLEVRILKYQKKLKQKLATGDGALKFSRMYSGQEYIKLLPHGLEVDKRL